MKPDQKNRVKMYIKITKFISEISSATVKLSLYVLLDPECG